MAQVLGIGGVFFKAADKTAVKDWYRRVLGFEITDWGGVVFPNAGIGQQVWSPFDADTKHFEPSTAPYMINLMVDDLDGVLAKAAAEGVEPTGRQDDEAFGKFAWIMDPNGIKVELWEPAAEAP
ncbi:MAG: VOC family protein [Phenylobacterium sp.]|nr:MAG: VOC family protein [Phenylobacterium sp.]